MKARVCELCNGEAALYCSSDSAFLCWNCDGRVHGANFLVARHARRTFCNKCEGFTGILLSGVGCQPARAMCRSCSPECTGDDVDPVSSSSSSACISSTESCATPPKKIDFDFLKSGIAFSSCSGTEVSSKYSRFPAKFSGAVTSESNRRSDVEMRVTKARGQLQSNVDSKAEGILVNWRRKLGLSGSSAERIASHAIAVCKDKLTAWPFRVWLAASLWYSLRIQEERWMTTWQNLKRLEEISGVPAKLIMAAEAKLSRILKMRKPRRHQPEEEGWAECSA